MALLKLWSVEPTTIAAMSIEQILAVAGDGRLLDDSECATELRKFLSEAPSELLERFAMHRLDKTFDKSGLVLQDVVNELGRRLDYVVENGRYQGRSNVVGHDGLWRSPEGRCLVIEVKTTDAYRISLDTIARYRARLLSNDMASEASSILIVVGRDQTGELEAQIRGSRHAWDIRVISVEALVRLVRIKEETEDTGTAAKIRSLLVPIEYTRVDGLIDILSSATKDVEAAQQEIQAGAPGEDSTVAPEIVDWQEVHQTRDAALAAFSRLKGVRLVRKTRALYWDADHSIRVACSVSKRYSKKGTSYWYAYHPAWDAFLAEASDGTLVLACIRLGVAFAIPVVVMRKHLPELTTTTRPNGQEYWHVKLVEGPRGAFHMQMPRSKQHMPLAEYQFDVG